MAMQLGMSRGDVYTGGWHGIARRFGLEDGERRPRPRDEVWAYLIERTGSEVPEGPKRKAERKSFKVEGEWQPRTVPKEPKPKGDVTSDAFLSTYEWRRVRMQALVKYGARCQCCGATPADGAVMNVDHIKPRKLFPQLALDVDNLQVLCGACNHGKGNWDMTDWREKASA